MSVLAWDGKTLAADKQANNGWTIYTTTKIWRDGLATLLGVTGNISVGMEMLRWYKLGAVPADYPASNRSPDTGASLVAIHKDHDGKIAIVKYESSPVPFPVEGLTSAFGSGDEAAMVAMACGKTAEEAVLLVSRFNTTCGGGVDTLEF